MSRINFKSRTPDTVATFSGHSDILHGQHPKDRRHTYTRKEIFGEIKEKSYHSCQRRVYNLVLKGHYSWGHPEYMESNMDEDIMLT